jgi:hypothetical protein
MPQAVGSLTMLEVLSVARSAGPDLVDLHDLVAVVVDYLDGELSDLWDGKGRLPLA